MKFIVQPIQGRADIVNLAPTMIMFAFTQSGATKIEA